MEGRQMKQFDFVKNRKYFFAFTILYFAIFAVMLVINGVSLDINFKGGTRISFETKGEVDSNKAASLVEQAIGKKASANVMSTYSSDTGEAKVNILRIDIAGNKPLTNDEESKVKDVLSKNFSLDMKSNKNEVVSIQPSIGKEALQKSIWAIFISFVLILLYVAWRFSSIGGFSAATCAIIALIHDIGVMFGVYIAFKIPLNDIFIATVLTVIGYSINDTVVIYDRIRENTRLMKKTDLDTITNISINQTMSRTINTMVMTLSCIVVLLVFSAANNIQSLIDFSFSLTIGIISGAYSTIFIAEPLWLIWKDRKQNAALKRA
jgi:preprotein translocase subunit SecF